MRGLSARELSGKDVLVTGGAGFIGSHLVNAIQDVAKVTVLDDLSEGYRENVPSDVEFVEGDIRDQDIVEQVLTGVDVVFHFAAVISVERSIDHPSECNAINVDGTINVLDAARWSDARVVLASSAAVYGPQDTVPITETAPKRPQSPYGIGKLAADHYCRRYHDLYGLETVSLRFFNVYGPGQSNGQYAGVVDIFRRQVLNEEPLTVHGDGSQSRDFVHVTDVVRANLDAVSTDAVGEAFNIGSGTKTTIDKLARLVRRVSGSEVLIQRTDQRNDHIDRSQADVTKAENELGFESRISIEDGIRRLLDDHQTRLENPGERGTFR